MVYKVAAYTLPEIFEKLPTLNSKQEKIDLLRRYNSDEMQWFLRATFGGQKMYDLEVPVYNPSVFPAGYSYSTLKLSLVQLNLIRRGHQYEEKKAQRILWRVLETVSAPEAKLVEQAIKGKAKIPGLTKTVVEGAFKGIVPETKKDK